MYQVEKYSLTCTLRKYIMKGLLDVSSKIFFRGLNYRVIRGTSIHTQDIYRDRQFVDCAFIWVCHLTPSARKVTELRMWKSAFATSFEVPYWQFPAGTEGKPRKSTWPVSRPVIYSAETESVLKISALCADIRTHAFRIQSMRDNHSTATLSDRASRHFVKFRNLNRGSNISYHI